MDGRTPATVEKPWNDDSPVNTSKQWFPMVSKWCGILSIHSTLGFGGGVPGCASEAPGRQYREAPCALAALEGGVRGHRQTAGLEVEAQRRPSEENFE